MEENKRYTLFNINIHIGTGISVDTNFLLIEY